MSMYIDDEKSIVLKNQFQPLFGYSYDRIYLDIKFLNTKLGVEWIRKSVRTRLNPKGRLIFQDMGEYK